MKIIDTHTHLYFPAFTEDRDDVVAACEQAGVVQQIQIGCDEVSCLAALKCAEKYGHKVVLGLHPCDVDKVGEMSANHRYDGMNGYKPVCKNVEAFFPWVEELYLKNKEHVVGWGETGYDLYHRDTPELLELQKYCTLEHLKLAKKYDLPVVFHIRDAVDPLLDVLEKWYAEHGPIRGIVHSFSDGPEIAEILVDKYDLHLGVGGLATYKFAGKIREAIAQTPIEMLVTETDAPFLAPDKAKKSGIKRNSSQYIPEVIEMIADIKGISVSYAADRLYKNAVELFSLGSE